MSSISWSLMPGMIGATSTDTGMPASASLRIASRRFAGVAARGSILRARRGSRRRHRQRDLGEAAIGHRRQDVDVARDEMRLRDDADRMVRPRQHLEHRARDPELLLDRLVGVGVRAHRHGLRRVARLCQLLLEELGGVRLREQLGLEIEPGREPLIGVGRAREAVDAAMLAAAIGVDRAVEADVGRVVSRDDGARPLDRHLGLERRRLFGQIPAVVEALAFDRLEAGMRVRDRAAPAPGLALRDRPRLEAEAPRRLGGRDGVAHRRRADDGVGAGFSQAGAHGRARFANRG